MNFTHLSSQVVSGPHGPTETHPKAKDFSSCGYKWRRKGTENGRQDSEEATLSPAMKAESNVLPAETVPL